MYGAYLAGSALAVVPTGLHHRLAHLIGGRHGLSHAATHSALLPHVVRYLEERDPDRLAPVRQVLDASHGAGPGLYELAVRIGAPTSLASLGLDGEALDAVAAEVDEALIPAGPLRALLADAHAGRRPEPLPRNPAHRNPSARNGSRPARVAGSTTRSRRRGGRGSTPAGWCCPPWTGSCEPRAARRSPTTRCSSRCPRRRSAGCGWRTWPTAPSRPAARSRERWIGSSGAAGCAARRRSTTSAGQYAQLTESGWQTIRALAPGHVRTVRRRPDRPARRPRTPRRCSASGSGCGSASSRTFGRIRGMSPAVPIDDPGDPRLDDFRDLTPGGPSARPAGRPRLRDRGGRRRGAAPARLAVSRAGPAGRAATVRRAGGGSRCDARALLHRVARRHGQRRRLSPEPRSAGRGGSGQRSRRRPG